MKNFAIVESSLDKLLSQSLDAAARSELSEDQVVAHLTTILLRIAAFFRNATAVAAQVVIESAAEEIDIEGRKVDAPRLLVQCLPSDPFLFSSLTFFYTPASEKRIALHIAFGGVVHRIREEIVWTAQHGWTFPSLGLEVVSDTHAKFLRDGLLEVGLFASRAMSLEPLIE